MTKSINNILVTGGAGYIGSHVCHLLIDQGYNVTCIDSLITGESKMIVSQVDKFKNYFNWKPKFNKLDYILITAYNWEKLK